MSAAVGLVCGWRLRVSVAHDRRPSSRDVEDLRRESALPHYQPEGSQDHRSYRLEPQQNATGTAVNKALLECT
jgi:hypothetical protein